ncbi:unnamed protein product [Vitrella brassicaformis CCMP3155]|uniref:Guanine nucleotide-binding protein subunit beta-like protein n=1 Tax=Vitrella brassicaformis (strain CCMP3155) TaxID=1169540 RepID=A0A0G4GUH7_VITBC|nr:unnamed protein product [Vitrella brassicaformis CCMP3155]|eukprot:CEM34428.1 unnamed protein product [Vitrella brassicaformis CCMP3155]
MFRIYDPAKCSIRHEVEGHRGTAITCCWVPPYNQIATTGADMTVSLWSPEPPQLRQRVASSEVQLSVTWAHTLWSGGIEGSLTAWNLSTLTATSVRKCHRGPLHDLTLVTDLDMLASCSDDSLIHLWDMTQARVKKTLKGHHKGVFSLSYSSDYHVLFSAGLDQDALAWNPYVERAPIFRMKGHAHALCGVQVLPGTPQIITADVAGTLRLWDVRNFRVVQSFGASEALRDLNTFAVMPKHKRIAAGAERIMYFDYVGNSEDEEGVTDQRGCCDALYNDTSGSLYVVSARSVQGWDLQQGALTKMLREVNPNEITAACFDMNQRKIYTGDAAGAVRCFNLYNGYLIREFHTHTKDVTCIAAVPGTRTLLSAGCDGKVKVHSDDINIRGRQGVLRAEMAAGGEGEAVRCLAVSAQIHLAAAGVECRVELICLKSLRRESTLEPVTGAVTALAFMEERPILAVGDAGGSISLWLTRPHSMEGTCMYTFENLDAIVRRMAIADHHEDGRASTRPSIVSGRSGSPIPPAHQHHQQHQQHRSAVPSPSTAPSSDRVLSPCALTALVFDEARGTDALYSADTSGSIRWWQLTRVFDAPQYQPLTLKAFQKAATSTTHSLAPSRHQTMVAGSHELMAHVMTAGGAGAGVGVGVKAKSPSARLAHAHAHAHGGRRGSAKGKVHHRKVIIRDGLRGHVGQTDHASGPAREQPTFITEPPAGANETTDTNTRKADRAGSVRAPPANERAASSSVQSRLAVPTTHGATASDSRGDATATRHNTGQHQRRLQSNAGSIRLQFKEEYQMSVDLLGEVQAHNDAVMSLRVVRPREYNDDGTLMDTAAPEWGARAFILSCALDKKVKAWSLQLEPLGCLVKSPKHREWTVPSQDAQRALSKLREAKEHLSELDVPHILARRASLREALANALPFPEAVPALPWQPPHGPTHRGPAGALMEIGQQTRDLNFPHLKRLAIDDDESECEEEYRPGGGLGVFEDAASPKRGRKRHVPLSMIEDRIAESSLRLFEDGIKRQAADVTQYRRHSLSEDEAKAAARLARLLGEAGLDPCNSYSLFAFTLLPSTSGHTATTHTHTAQDDMGLSYSCGGMKSTWGGRTEGERGGEGRQSVLSATFSVAGLREQRKSVTVAE